MILFDGLASTGTSESTNIGSEKTVFIHICSTTTSTATVKIQQSVGGGKWHTVATVSNPTAEGELWKGPSLPKTRVTISAYSAGTIWAFADFAMAETTAWAQVDATTPTSGVYGLIRKDITNAELVALGEILVGNVLVGTLPANSRLIATYFDVTTAETSANNLTVSMGVTGTGYVDWIVASDAKTKARLGDAAAERGATNIDGALFYTTAQSIYAQFTKTTTHMADLTAFAGTAWVEYAVYPA